jgi:hypothetical protein
MGWHDRDRDEKIFAPSAKRGLALLNAVYFVVTRRDTAKVEAFSVIL